MADSEEKESIDLIFHILQEHEDKLEALDKTLDEMKSIMGHYSQLVKSLSEEKPKQVVQHTEVPDNILVVDDDPSVVKTFKMILEGIGYSVDTANNALDAIRKTSKIHFDLVIIDMNLPDTLGDELAERLISINDKLRIIMVTGYGNYMEPTLRTARHR